MRLAKTFIIAMHGIKNYSLLMPNLVVSCAKLNEVFKLEFHFVMEVSFSIFIYSETKN